MLSYCMGSGVSQQPNPNEKWVYVPNNNIETSELDIGKWIFVFPREEMEKYWNIAKDLYNHRGPHPDLNIIGIKCLNVFSGPFTILKEGVIMFFFDESSNNEKIINDGYRLLIKLKYSYNPYIIYKRNHDSMLLYEINNRLYKSKCKLCLSEIVINKEFHRDICMKCKTIRTNKLDAIIENDAPINNNFVKD